MSIMAVSGWLQGVVLWVGGKRREAEVGDVGDALLSGYAGARPESIVGLLVD